MNQKGFLSVSLTLTIVAVVAVSIFGFSTKSARADFYEEVDKANYCTTAFDCAGVPPISVCVWSCGGPAINKNEMERITTLGGAIKCTGLPVPPDCASPSYSAPTVDCIIRKCQAGFNRPIGPFTVSIGSIVAILFDFILFTAIAVVAFIAELIVHEIRRPMSPRKSLFLRFKIVSGILSFIAFLGFLLSISSLTAPILRSLLVHIPNPFALLMGHMVAALFVPGLAFLGIAFFNREKIKSSLRNMGLGTILCLILINLFTPIFPLSAFSDFRISGFILDFAFWFLIFILIFVMVRIVKKNRAPKEAEH